MILNARFTRILVAVVAATIGFYLFTTFDAREDTLRTGAFLALLLAMALLVFAAVRQARRDARDRGDA